MEKLDFPHEIRDPIHGLIGLTEKEFNIIDTFPFQRLRKIKQLALANLVFPGGVHTRFEHSIGVLHVAGRIISHLREKRKVNISLEEEQNIRLAALLHDIGHGPFSHVSEELLQRHYKGTAPKNEIHEEISVCLINDNPEIIKILGKNICKSIIKLLKKETKSNYQHDIVSSPIDADKMDYLLRDSYYCGVKYGVFDLDRMINVLDVTSEEKGERLSINSEGIETIEQYILAKYFITQQVYQHRIRRITDIMIIESIDEAINDHVKELYKLFAYAESKAFIEHYLKFNDQEVEKILNSWIENKHHKHLHYSLLSNRKKLLKELYCDRADVVAGKYSEDTSIIEKLIKGDDKELCKIVSNELGLIQEFTHIRVHSLKKPSPARTDNVFDKEVILIKFSDKKTANLVNESVIFGSLSENAKKNKISVYGLPTKKFMNMNAFQARKKIEEILRDYIRRQS